LRKNSQMILVRHALGLQPGSEVGGDLGRQAAQKPVVGLIDKPVLIP